MKLFILITASLSPNSASFIFRFGDLSSQSWWQRRWSCPPSGVYIPFIHMWFGVLYPAVSCKVSLVPSLFLSL